jgi:hypothetical protein
MSKSLTLMDVLSSESGSRFRVSSENELCNTTVEKRSTAIINVRTGAPIEFTQVLATSKFRPVQQETQLTLEQMITSYNEGKKIKIVMSHGNRIVEKEELPEELKQLLAILPVPGVPMSADEVITFEELTHGKFYLV